MKKTLAAIYIRVSTLDQAREGYSLEAQEAALRRWCADRKYDVYDLYADRGISGKDIYHRPDMRRMMADAKDKKFDIILFWALSRFTRSVSDLYNTMEILQKLDIGMISYTESFDTTTPMGRAMIGIIGVFAQLERELTGERVKAAMLVRAEKGLRVCSDVIGYDPKGKDGLEINEKEAEYVRFLFDKYRERKNLTEVAQLAREAGYRGKRGGIPQAWHVERILRNPIYAGYNYYCGQLYKGNHDSIISVSDYNKVQKLLHMHGCNYGRHKKYPLIHIPVK